MKRIMTSVSWMLAVFFLLPSCKKEEYRIYYMGGKQPTLTASTASVNLQPPPADESVEAIRFDWTNPEYKFTTGVNSQDVNYLLEIDTVGANFGSKSRFSTTVSKDLTKRYTVAELNAILGNTMALPFGRRYSLEARITSSVGGNNAIPLTSNKITFTATPYAPPPKVALPVTGRLFIVGNATPGGWNNPVPLPSQEFTKRSNTLFDITIPLSGAGNFYLFLPENGSWGSKYAVADNQAPGIANGGEFRFYTSGGQDFPAPSAAGNYKITVDFQKGIFTVVKQ